jgi:hypothetical protein
MGGNTAFGSYATVLGGNGGLLLASATTTNRIYGMSPRKVISGRLIMQYYWTIITAVWAVML